MNCTDKLHVKINKSSKQHVKLYELFKKNKVKIGASSVKLT